MLTIVIQYLGEMERRRLSEDLGFPSLYAFCTKDLGYSEPEALFRIRAARLILEIPSALGALEDGRLSMTVASKAQCCLQRQKDLPIEKKQEIVAELFRVTSRQADRILATHFPQQPTPERKTPIDSENTRLEFIIPKTVFLDMERLLAVRSHTNPSKRLDKLFGDLCKLGLWKWDPMHPRWHEKAATR